MKLRFSADRRALFWALLLFPALPVVSYVEPERAPWLLPLALYLAYCSGVLAHNHNHLPMFQNRRLNSAYSAWLSFFYGCPLFVWVPTHNQNHHRYLNGPGDLTRAAERGTHNAWTALCYPTRSALAQFPVIWHFVRAAQRGNAARFRRIVLETASVVLGHAALGSLAVHIYGLARGALLYALSLGIPAGFSSWSMMLTNYLQHVGCDHASPHGHSRNFVSRSMNWLLFNAGYHTVHHEHPACHWSTYPKLHSARAPSIPERLNQRTIQGYFWSEYLLAALTTIRASSLARVRAPEP